MSLWGCDCPLLALAAYHRRGMVCCRLSLFSPLFRVRAWWCLRLGLAFHVVDIPQSGLLAQNYFAQIVLGVFRPDSCDAACTAPPCPAPACLWQMQASALLLGWGSYRRARNVRVLIIYFFSLLCCPLCFQGSAQIRQ